MELFTVYLLPLFLLPLSFCLLLFNHKKGSNDPKNLPPGYKGWPFLGETIDLAMSGFPKFVEHRMEKHSPDVFRTSLLGENIVVLCGAAGNKFVMSNEKKHIMKWFPPSLKKVVFPEFENGIQGPKALFSNFRNDVLNLDALKKYIPVMDEVAREHVRHVWSPNSVVKALPSAKKYTFELASKIFLNLVDPGRVDKLMDPYSLMTKAIISLPVDLPGTTFNRGVKGSKVVHDEMRKVVEERRKEVMEKGEGPDLLSKMLLLTDEDGKHVSDSKIAGFFAALLMATFESTATSIATVLNHVAELPHIYEEVRREQMEIAKSKGPNELLTWEDTEKMKYSWNVIRESFRLACPALGGFSEVTTEFTYKGFTIPKGWKTLWTVHSTHSNPEYYPQPEKFDPSRFEGSGPTTYTFLPFGGGTRICPGRNYAKLAILVFLHNVVTRFSFEKAIPDEKLVVETLPTLPHGLLLRLHRHQE